MAETETPPRSTPDPPTRSLRAAMNPQARMQELLQRPAPSEPQVDATTLPVGSATSSAVAQTTTSEGSSVAAKEVGSADAPVSASKQKPPSEKRSTASAPKPSSVVTQDTSSAAAQKRSSSKAHTSSSARHQKRSSAGGTDPVRQAMLGMLAQPYPDDMDEGAMTVTSVKIPKPIWERLEYARTITKRDKQDIIADALRLYFDTLLEASGTNGEGEE